MRLIMMISLITFCYSAEEFGTRLDSDTSQVRSGKFIEIDYDVEGSVTVSIESDKLRISFSTDFESDEGPDLFVMLTSKADEHQKSDYKVAKLKKFEGKQSYVVNDITIDDFDYIQIWCKQYDVVFSSAKLSDLK